MLPPSALLTLRVEGHRVAIPLAQVDRVIRLIGYAPLPQVPHIVLGAVNIEGVVMPLVSLRRRFSFADRLPGLSDHLVLARTSRRPIALLADEAYGLEPGGGDDWVAIAQIVAGASLLSGVVKRSDGLVLVHDLDACLSLEDEAAVDQALGSMKG